MDLAPARRDGVERGKLETIEYESKTVGNKRKAIVYTPPGFSKDTKYPVLYLLHGIGGDQQEWTRQGAADVVLDNLYADKKAVPMIVVMPKGRARPDDRPGGDFKGQGPAFEKFEEDLSCGDTDRLINISRRFHEVLDEKKVPHVWHVDTGGHTWAVWKNDLYLVAPKLFRDK